MAITLSAKSVGDIVKLNINGVATNFIVVHQGNPDSSVYDSSCDGTWLLMEDIYETRAFGGSQYYNESGICSYLNDTFVNLFDSDIKDAIKQVKIPCDTRNGLDVVSAKVFLLSHREVDFINTSYATVEGFELSYFDGGGNTKRIAKFNGTASVWWTRTRSKSPNSTAIYAVDTDGTTETSFTASATKGVRPALVLPSTLDVDGNGNVVISNTVPSESGMPSFSNPKGGKALTVSWTAATDVDGNLSGYILETQLDGGSWTQVYKGSALSYSYTVPEGTETIAFRVKAYDSYDMESSYATSSTVAVLNDVIGIQGASAIIGGIQKDLTGVGYVCIAGVWKSLVNSYVCIDGIWKSMMGGVDLADLPDGYIQLEYIQSSGTQYIDTGFIANSNTKAVMDCELTYPSGWVMVMGSYNSGAYFSWWTKDSNIYAYYGSANQNTTGPTGRTTITADKNVWSVWESSLTFTASSFTATTPIYLFSVSNGGDYTLGSMKLYSCQIYDNDALIRDFVPCMNSSGEVGLYDMVNKMFYSNAGTSVFTAGKPVNSTFYPLPGNFTSAEYVQSSGTQWIDTGFVPNANTRIVMDSENLSATASTCYFGARSAASSTNAYACVFFTNINGESNMRLDYYGSTKTVSCNSLQRLLLDWNKNVTTIGDVTTVTNTASANSSAYNLCLLAVNTAGTVNLGASAKLYSCQIYDNGTLIRDYIPCANANGEAGLWDKVNGVFYSNAGTGEFTVG